MAQTQLQPIISEPLTGEDAERFVAYIEKPTPPSGHDAYLAEADRAFASIKPRQDTRL
jgi:hypothetical protein